MGISAILLIIGHSTAKVQMPTFLFWLFSFLGNLSVDLFLVISGISMFFSASKSNNHIGFEWICKRFKRILVPYFIVCFPLRVVLILLGKENVLTTLKFFSTYTYWKSGNGDWFVIEILICYLITPLLLNEKNRPIKIRIITLICFAFLISNIEVSENIRYFKAIIERMPAYYLGFILGGNIKDKKAIQTKTLIVWSFISLMCFVCGNYFTKGVYKWIIAVPVLLWISILLQCVNKEKNSFILKVTDFMGDISFESYLNNVYWPNIFLLISINGIPFEKIYRGLSFYILVILVGIFFSALVHWKVVPTLQNMRKQKIKS